MTGKTIFVFSVTGAQGKAVALTLHSKGWSVTGLTRDPSGTVAQELASTGISLVKGDLDDPETYAAYLEGHAAVFLNTDFFASFFTNGYNVEEAMAKEIRQGIAAVDACERAGVKHLVYSALEDYPESKTVPFTATKARISEHIRRTSLPATLLFTSTYYGALIRNGWLSYDKASSSYQLSIPLPDHSKFFCFDVDQLGDWVSAIVEDLAKYAGRNVQVAGDKISPAEIADAVSLHTGIPVNMRHVDEDSFYSELKDVVPMPVWSYMRVQHEGLVVRDLDASRDVNPQQKSFARWVSSSKELSQLKE